MSSNRFDFRGHAVVLFAAIGLAACGGGEQAAPAGAQPGAQQPAAQVPAGGAPAVPAAEPAPVVLPVPDLLRSASLAVAEDRLVVPAGNNAIEFYLAVIAQEPNNVQATQALVDIFPLAATIAEREIGQRRLEEADRIVGLLDRASPGSYTVTTIKAKLETLRTQQQRELDAQLFAQQRAVAEAAAAAAAAAQAASAPVGTDAPSPAQSAAAAPRPATSPPPAPAPAPAAAEPAPAPATAAPSGETRDARVVRQVPPEYPTQAARKRQTGWVELEFTVGADGKVKDVAVVRAQPPRVFDREAVRAVQQWTFEPALKDGQAVEAKARRRLEFQL